MITRFYYAFGTASLLPVKLTAFTAATQNRNVTLNWTTASQSGVSRYEVQRSSGTDQYATIAVIDATADKHGSVNYSYTDKTAVDGAYTYRLKIVDQDESVEYSKVVLAGALSSVPYKIYPTHVIRGQNIQIISADTGSADASLMDVSGKMIGNYKMKNSLSIPTDQLRQGLYLIKISGEGKNIPVQKIVVQ